MNEPTKKEVQKRGALTERIKEKSKELLGYEIKITELRLMAYIQFTMCNSQKINGHSINKEDREIMSKWRKTGHIEGGMAQMGITKEFWDAICELIFLGYVDID